jgi:hypothetical protein
LDFFFLLGFLAAFFRRFLRLEKRRGGFFRDLGLHLRLFSRLFRSGGRPGFVLALFNPGHLKDIPGRDSPGLGDFPGKEKQQRQAVKKKG